MVFALSTSDSLNVFLTVTQSSNGGGGGPVNPPPPPPPPVPLTITNIQVTPSFTTAHVTWQTNASAISTLSWGATQDYELGTIIEGAAGTVHSADITGLDPGTTYYFTISAQTQEQPPRSASSGNQTFQTRSRILSATSFRAQYNATNKDIDLTWRNPTDPDFDVVRIMRSTTFFPTTEQDGEFVYQGSAEATVDVNVVPGTTYYYSLFVRSREGQFSAPLVDSAYVPKEGEIVPPPEQQPNPFQQFPTVEIPGLENFSLLEFEFLQKDRRILFQSGDVPVDGAQNLQISVDYDKLPEVLKTIGITLQHPQDKNKVFSFLLRANDAKTKYTATIAPLLEPGSYDMTITILDYKNQGVKRIIGRLIVTGPRFINNPTVLTLTDKVAPIGAGIGVASGIVETTFLLTHVESFYDLYLAIARLIGAVAGIFGVRRKRQPWGTIYDSVTKRPLDPAYVTVHSGDTEVADSITDLDGRYGFLVPEGTYTLDSNKTHYQFPSKLLAGKTRDELYDSLYFGEPVSAKEGDVVIRNIPMDPVGFDWNEFVKNKEGLFRLYNRRDRIKRAIFVALYGFGFASSAFAFLITPSLWNFCAVLFYTALLVFQTLWKRQHVAVKVRNAETREPLPYAIIRVFAAHLNEQVKAVVADALGRFYILIAPGTYYLTVDAKKPDGSYEKVYTSPILELKKGVLASDIVVGHEATATGTLASLEQKIA